jgi:hypothetical protein
LVQGKPFIDEAILRELYRFQGEHLDDLLRQDIPEQIPA